MGIWESILLAVSLCADCFACTLCAGVNYRGGRGRVVGIALAFAVIHCSLLLIGWFFGYLLVGYVERISHWIGFLLLLYVGGKMLWEGLRSLQGRCEERSLRLDGIVPVALSALATSIDALGVGISGSMIEETRQFSAIGTLVAVLFVVTVLTVVGGLLGGRAIGQRFGHWAEVGGGLVLVGIGVSFLL